MMMIVDTNESSKSTSEITNELGQIGEEIGVLIQAQNEDIFNMMHRI
jgi:ACT domain-containing protein